MTAASAQGKGYAPSPAWIAALTLVLAGHVALGLALHRPPTAPPAPAAPEAALFIDLPPEEALPPAETVESIASEASEAVEPTEAAAAPPDPPEVTIPPELAAKTPPPFETRETEAEHPPPSPPPMESVEAPKAVDAIDPVPPDVRPKAKPRPVITKPKVAKVQPRREVAASQKKAAPEAVAGEKASGAGRPDPDALAGYSAAVRKRIMRHRSDVAAGGARNQRVTVSFTVASDGRVSGVKVAASSGNAALDEAAVTMVRRADPLPAIPPEIGRSSLRLSLPVRFDG